MHMEAKRPVWTRLDGQPRPSARDLREIDVPTDPGVYAWYRRGRAVYVGEADDLRARLWGNHLGQGRSVGTSAFRRNVAEHLGFGSAAEKANAALIPVTEAPADLLVDPED